MPLDLPFADGPTPDRAAWPDQAAERIKDVLLRIYGTPQTTTHDAGVELIVWTTGQDQVGFMRATDPATAVGTPVTSVNYQPLAR